MKLSYEWLNEFLDLSEITPQELGEKMSRTGIEVDSVEIPGEGMKKIVVGKALTVEPHPDSDHLHIVQVDVGEDEPIQIVCGAPNIASGQKIIVAMHGSRIASGQKIKRGKLRGVPSNGMICSLQELGISESLVPKAYEEGIYVFEDESVEVGSSAIEALGLDSAIVELDITANRADALSMRGAVHEISAIYGLKHKLGEDVFLSGESNEIPEYITVNVQNTEDVPAYHAQIIKNVTVKPSPQWMQNRLMAAGIRPINNIVDITNYVLIEFGQPLHAFDYDKLNSKEILVRRATDGETLTTLDEVERTLTDEIIITDGKKPIALAGVMGGYDTEISNETTTVLLESAVFNPVAIRTAAATHNLRSESSSRFEKGINLTTILQAGKRAAELMVELAGGELVPMIASHQVLTNEKPVVSIRLSRLNHVLGTDLSVEEVTRIFDQLGFPCEYNNDVFTVTVPLRRWDISIEADLVEEVGRIYGYDLLPQTMPTTESTQGGLTDKQRFVRWTRQFMQGAGLSQAYSYALTTPEKSHWFTLENHESIRLDLPMSEDRSELRQSLLPSLLEAVQYNVNRKQSDVRLFEVGKIFSIQHNEYVEQEVIGAAITGNVLNKTWQTPAETVDFFMIKGILEAYFAQMACLENIRFEALTDMEQLHPGQSALIYLNEEVIGFVGQVHPLVQKDLGLKQTFVFELALEPLLTMNNKQRDVKTVAKYPGMSRDIALLVPITVSNDNLITIIKANGGNYLQSVTLFDVYQGENVEAGFKSLAYSLQFLNREATLQEEDVTKAMDEIMEALQTVENLTIR